MIFRILVLAAMFWVVPPVLAGNTPCSGMKGGIAHCQGDLFICVDESVSRSKRSCPAYLGSAVTIPVAAPLAAMPASSGFHCGAKTTCREMSSCAEARFYLRSCGLSKLDRNGDGVPCESICR